MIKMEKETKLSMDDQCRDKLYISYHDIQVQKYEMSLQGEEVTSTDVHKPDGCEVNSKLNKDEVGEEGGEKCKRYRFRINNTHNTKDPIELWFSDHGRCTIKQNSFPPSPPFTSYGTPEIVPESHYSPSQATPEYMNQINMVNHGTLNQVNHVEDPPPPPLVKP